jgi:nucleotide-binding universal stress UspA family protein
MQHIGLRNCPRSWQGFLRIIRERANQLRSGRPVSRMLPANQSNFRMPTVLRRRRGLLRDARRLWCRSIFPADYAIEIARHSQARLILLHAIHLNLTPYGPANPRWLRAALCREALEKMESTMTRAQSVGVPVISVIEEGPPAKVISEAAKRWKTDLIILASQKRGKWARLWSQRIREKVARGAACPVVVMRRQSKKGTMA